MASPSELAKRCVFVELIDGRANCPYEIILGTGKSDFKQIEERIVAKNPSLASVFKSGDYSFQRESEFRKAMWVRISEDSPIKNLSQVRCVLSRIPQLFFEGNCVPLTQEFSQSENFDMVLNSTPILTLNDSQARPSFSSEKYSVTDEDFVNSTPLELPSTEQPESEHSLSNIHSQPIALEGSSSDTEDVNTQDIFNQIYPLSDRQDKLYCRLDTSTYKIPTFFGTALTKKIKDQKALLTDAEYKSIYRTLADSIEVHTLHPHPDSLRFVVDTTLSKFPNLVIDKKDSVATNGIFYLKLQRIMEYRRRVAKEPFNSKGGRVKNKINDNDHGPAAKITRRGLVQNTADLSDEVDAASYTENVKKLLQVCRDFGSAETIKTLVLLTYEGRRQDIAADKFKNVADVLKTACPVLNQASHLQREFERMKGIGICKTFMNNWTKIVPKVLKLAKRMDTLAIAKVLHTYPPKELESCFDICACAALEVLPLLAPVRNKKSVVASQYLYYPKDDSVSLEDVLRETINRPPFILHIGDSFHVVVDNEVLLTSSTSSEALLNVFCCYYVFAINYSKPVLRTLLLLQSEVFGLKDECSAKCPGLPLLINNLNAA